MTKLSLGSSVRGERLEAILEKQKAAHIAAAPVTLEQRQDRLNRLIRLTCENSEAIVDALVSDYCGARSRHTTLMTELVAKVHGMEHARDHLATWMAPEPRETNAPAKAGGASSHVLRQPKGVVGIIAPWNMPFGLAISPLTSAIAAGNRAMIKPSEFAPAIGTLMQALFRDYFSDEEVAVVLGGREVGEAFARLPFDHLLFTGSTSVGREVMRLASENLVPVTLELGGKSPVIVGETARLESLPHNLAFGKMINGGQLCLAPDYALVARRHEASLVERVIAEATAMFPSVYTNGDHTGIINAAHYERLSSYVEDARQKGATITIVGSTPSTQISSSNNLRMPLHIVQNVSDDMLLMQNEIFGPILPIKTFDKIDEAIHYVRQRPKPLALYYYGADPDEQALVVERTESGGVTINDMAQHYMQEDLPFGGVGPSGMGAYHGRDGFLEFSHTRAIFKQALDAKPSPAFRPPFNDDLMKFFQSELKRRLDGTPAGH